MDVLPKLPGLTWNIVKSPRFSNLVQTSDALVETRAALALYPIWTLSLEWELLRDDQTTQNPASPYDELKTLMGFFLKQQGNLKAWLYDDPSDDAVSAMQFGTGDAATAAFQLLRTFGANGFTFSEPVQNINGSPSIFCNDWQGNQLMYATARTNLAPHSQTLGSWTAGGITVTQNAASAPDTTNTANLLTETAATSSHVVDENGIAVTASAPYTFSVYLKANAGAGLAQILVDDNSANGFYVNVNLGTQAITAHGTYGTGTYIGSSIQAVGSGWVRVAIAGTQPGSAARISINSINTGAATSFPVYAGSTGNSFLAWGAQLEAGSTVTSYIATTLSSATLTDYTLSATGLVTFAAAPLAGAVLTWTGSYYWRVRFMLESQDFNEFMNQLWEAKKVQIIGSVVNKV